MSGNVRNGPDVGVVQRWPMPTLLPMRSDVDRKSRLSFAISWAMWKRGVTPPQVAAAIGKDAQTVRRWRDGETAPSVLDVGPLAQALGLRVDFFTNPPAVPEYPFEEYVVDNGEEATSVLTVADLLSRSAESGVPDGIRRARTDRVLKGPGMPVPSKKRPLRGSGAGRA